MLAVWMVVSSLLLGQAPAEQPLSVALVPVNDEVPGHAPAALDALLASAFTEAERDDDVRLVSAEVAQVLLAPTLWLGPKGEVRVRWVLTPRERPKLERRLAFEFNELETPAQFGAAQAQAMLGPVLEAARALEARSQRAAAGELSVPPPPPPTQPVRARPRTIALRMRVTLLPLFTELLPVGIEFQGAVHPNLSLFVAPELVVVPGRGLSGGVEFGLRAYPFGRAPFGFSIGASLNGQWYPPRRSPLVFPVTAQGTIGYSRVWKNGVTAGIFLGAGYGLLFPSREGLPNLSASGSIGYAF